jgi:DNA-binding transcriptional regulator YdaS (Cro superfamily)
VAELFDALGGANAVSRLLGVSGSHVKAMQQQNYIAPKHYLAVAAALPRPNEMPNKLFSRKGADNG